MLAQNFLCEFVAEQVRLESYSLLTSPLLSSRSLLRHGSQGKEINECCMEVLQIKVNSDEKATAASVKCRAVAVTVQPPHRRSASQCKGSVTVTLQLLQFSFCGFSLPAINSCSQRSALCSNSSVNFKPI